MHWLGHSYPKKLLLGLLKFKFHWLSYILCSNSIHHSWFMDPPLPPLPCPRGTVPCPQPRAARGHSPSLASPGALPEANGRSPVHPYPDSGSPWEQGRGFWPPSQEANEPRNVARRFEDIMASPALGQTIVLRCFGGGCEGGGEEGVLSLAPPGLASCRPDRLMSRGSRIHPGTMPGHPWGLFSGLGAGWTLEAHCLLGCPHPSLQT